MKETWRWFGPRDIVSIDDMLQAGVKGVVTALHHVPTGDAWPDNEIRKRQAEIARMKNGSPSGLSWDVVESLPVSEDIKKQQGDWRQHFINYRKSLNILAQNGIRTVCYNFMPVLDWTRTDLAFRLPNGATCMRFDLSDFAAFDLYILCRPDASEDYPAETVEAAKRKFVAMSDDDQGKLTRNIVSGLPGAAANFSINDVRQHLADYRSIKDETLRGHLIDFLSEIIPEAEALGIRMCCHPDDPPFPLLGLPRILSTEQQFSDILQTINSPANGMTLCSGSLGVRPDNDLDGMMRRLGDRVHFLHLRNVRRESPVTRGSFHEAEHLGGSTDMIALLNAVLNEEARRRELGREDHSIPMRPDHGQDILDDLNRQVQPGYPSIGRLKGLAELRGAATALSHPGF